MTFFLGILFGVAAGIAIVALLQKSTIVDDEPRLNFLDARSYSLMYFIATQNWGVVRWSDGRTSLLGKGSTPREAIDHAMEASHG